MEEEIKQIDLNEEIRKILYILDTADLKINEVYDSFNLVDDYTEKISDPVLREEVEDMLDDLDESLGEFDSLSRDMRSTLSIHFKKILAAQKASQNK